MDLVQRAIQHWVSRAQLAAERLSPAESLTRIAEMRAQVQQGALDRRRAPPRRRGKSPRSLALVEASRAILEEIQPASVRAVCYRLFILGLITSMAKSETNRVSAQLTRAREQGRIPWSWIVDETRSAERVSAWEDPAAYVETVKRAYRRDRWTDQPHWIEVWSEKGTVRGTLAPVLHDYGVTFRVMHGYGSTIARLARLAGVEQ